VGVVGVLGGEQDAAQLAAVHAVTFWGLHFGPPQVLARVGCDASVDVSEPEVPTDGRKTPVDLDAARPRRSMLERYDSMWTRVAASTSMS
jgi:hypothetical protein